MKKLYCYRYQFCYPYESKVLECEVSKETEKTYVVDVPSESVFGGYYSRNTNIRKSEMASCGYRFAETEEQAVESLKKWLADRAELYRRDSEEALKRASLCDEAIKSLEEGK